MSLLEKFDRYLKADGPAALVIREHLMSVEGTDGVVFPSTFAAGDGFEGGYNIDGDPNGENVCLIDTVGSQANRIEPLFMEPPYADLVPQIVVKAGDKSVNILEAGHRAGDAVFRCSPLKDRIDDAFRASVKGDAEPLAKLAPTSLVFGVWNSRGEKGAQDKRPRLIVSTIRAYNVRLLTRSAVYNAPVDYSMFDVFSEEDKAKAEGDSKNPLSKRGFVNALASGTPGGVIAKGGIRRDSVLGLAALRLLRSTSKEKTVQLQRYILGLSLVAFTQYSPGYLRQGCLLVLDSDKPRECSEVLHSGKRVAFDVETKSILEYAQAVAKAFGVEAGETVDFSKEKAKADVSGGGDGEVAKDKKTKKGK